MILLLDNYDSFTYNLFQYLCELGAEVEVVRNDKISVEEVFSRGLQGLVISPGPCTPNEAGISLPLMARATGSDAATAPPFPVLGVCLGHQCMGQAAGGVVERAPLAVHGKVWSVRHDGTSRLFAGVPDPFLATRYHSLVVRRDSVPATLRVTAWTEDGLVMAAEHRERPVFGVQFHPESIMTASGKRMLANFLEVCGIRPDEAAIARHAMGDGAAMGRAAGAAGAVA
jgi:anthranilate synthase/aminodeoxychorismate synthase-like glutamine amidotransferase